jgi:sec-independent protein translocase protein TatA
MGAFSLTHWLLVAGAVMLLFGGGRIFTRTMGDLGQGLRQFKSGMTEALGPTAPPTAKLPPKEDEDDDLDA